MEVSKGFLTSPAKVLKDKCAWICNTKLGFCSFCWHWANLFFNPTFQRKFTCQQYIIGMIDYHRLIITQLLQP